MPLSLLALLALLACRHPALEPLADTAASPPFDPPSSGTYSLAHGGLERTYRLHVPANLAPGAPLVFVWHGYTDSARAIARYSGLSEVAEREGFAVVYPQGTRDSKGNTFFNVGYAFHSDATVDDVGYFRALVALLVPRLQADPSRVFSTGLSNGGDMSLLLACAAADLVAAVAPVAGAMMVEPLAPCAPTHPTPVLAIHGTLDEITRWEGDYTNTDGWGAYHSVDAMIAYWVETNALSPQGAEPLPDLDPEDGSTVTRHTWASPGVDAEVQLLEVVGGGHDWPGSWGNQDIESAEEIWRFLSRW